MRSPFSRRGAVDERTRRHSAPAPFAAQPERRGDVDTRTSRHRPSERTSRPPGYRHRPVHVAPTSAQWTDLAFCAALCAVALEGFRVTYGGWQYFVVGVVGVLLGLLIGHLGTALRQPVLAALAAAGLTFFLLGGAVALHAKLALGFLPTPDAVRQLGSVSVHGWKDLLTTLPPVGDTGSLLVIPYLLGIIGGVAGASLAERTRAALAPLLAPLAILVAVILLGTGKPASLLLQGGAFVFLMLGWLAVRNRRARITLRATSGRRSRLAIGLAMLVVAGTAGYLAGPYLPGHGAQHRFVLRDYITPPFDISQFPSPLSAFRKYTKDGALNQTELFRLSGLPAGVPVKIATLDDYDGTSWVSSNTISTQLGTSTFQRVGSSIAAPGSGRTVSAKLTVGPGYSDVWVPTVGELTKIRFSGGDDTLRAFRYNLASTTGVLQGGVRDGERIAFSSVLVTAAHEDLAPFGEPIVSPDYYQFTSSQIQRWSGNADSPWAQLVAVGHWMRDNGAYTDGGGSGRAYESAYVSGHSMWRLTNMINDAQLAGDDEQYAALYALVAAQLGFPARVVLGAVPEPDGTVKGADVHAWIEVHLAGGDWRAVPTADFVPDESHHPKAPKQQQEQTSDGKNVPPPNTVKPPSTQQNPEEPQANAARNPARKKNNLHVPLPSAILKFLLYAGLPTLIIAAVLGGIVGLKDHRRRRRRTRGSPAERIEAGWRELLDRARDFGVRAPAISTRPEQARLLGHPALPALAVRADAGVFAAALPSPSAAEAYWIEVQRARRDMGHGRSRWRRLRAALSLRSLRSA